MLSEIDAFKEELFQVVQSRLPDAEIKTEQVVKTNGVRKTGITVKFENQSVVPIFYLEDLYKETMSGIAVQDIAERIVNICEKPRLNHDIVTE